MERYLAHFHPGPPFSLDAPLILRPRPNNPQPGPGTGPSDNAGTRNVGGDESLFLLLLDLNIIEIPLFRVLSFLYSYYNINPIFRSDVEIFYLKVTLLKSNYKVISFVVMLSVVLLTYYLCYPINCDGSRA